MTWSNRGSISSVTISVESISLRLGLSLIFDNTVVDQTSTMTESLNSSIVGPSVTTDSLLELLYCLLLRARPMKLYYIILLQANKSKVHCSPGLS